MSATMEKPTELGDVKEYRLAHETLKRVQGELADCEAELRDVGERLNTGSLEIEAQDVLEGKYDLSEKGNLRSRHNDLVEQQRAQKAAIEKQQQVVNQAKTRASVEICKSHRAEYRDLVEQTRGAAEELLKLTESRMQMQSDLKSRGINWYLPILRPLELDTRLPALLKDCDEALAELNRGED